MPVLSKSLKARLGVVLVAGAIAATVLPSAPAQAFGNNRTVSRGCGDNWIASGSTDYIVFAQTQKSSGSCEGRLSVTIELDDGYRYPRLYGSNTNAYMSIPWPAVQPAHGVHWGCDSCGQSLT